ncbi:MAG: hypothetical protein WC459_01275 [Patescibacteria group bacterium]
MTDKDIKKILKDLYKLEPSLADREVELMEIIKEFALARPDTKFDKKFQNEIKNKLLGRFLETDRKIYFWQNFMNGKKLFFGFGGAIILILIAVPLAYSMYSKNSNFNFGFEQRVKSVGDGAFGNLWGASGGSNNLGMGGEEYAQTSAAPAPMMAENDAAAETRSLGVGGGGGSKAMIAPEATNITFKYIGEKLDLSQEKVSVLKRERTGEMAKKFGGVLGNINTGMLNLSKFKNLEAQNISLSENRDNGYNIYFDVGNETITLNQNWSKWAGIYDRVACPPDSACPESSRLEEKDIPADEALISVADNFIKNYSINKNIYGAPEIDKTWRRYYLLAKEQNDAAASIPQEMSVLYPLAINGKQVYEQYGGKVGLRVGIDIKNNNKVTGVYGLETQSYSSSDYAAEMNGETIIKFAEQGGVGGSYYYGGGKTVTLELMTPQAIYVRQWKYSGMESSELFVPSLLFKVKEMPKDGYYSNEYIAVPLVKEMLRSPQNGDDDIKSMPATRSGSGSSPSVLIEPALPEKSVE